MVAFIAFSLYAGVFMLMAYPQIPDQFGGGQPRVVRLLVEKDAVPALEQLGLRFPSESEVTDFVELLYEGNTQYVLRIEGNQVIKLNKDLVSAIA
jgi:hypothetical protein